MRYSSEHKAATRERAARRRDLLAAGELDKQEYYRQLLRAVYRLLFLFVAEDRDLLLARGDEYRQARERYLSYYSTQRLRQLAAQRRGSRRWCAPRRIRGPPVARPSSG